MYDLNPFKTEMQQASAWLAKEFSQLHTGRAAPALLDNVHAEAYGIIQPLKNLASISIEDPRTLRVLPWDKSQIKDIERSLHASNLGFSISVDDAGIRVIIPTLTTETRNHLVKIAKERLEDARITVRKARESMIGALKDQKLPEDTFIRAKDEVQRIIDDANRMLEEQFKKKEEEILN